MGRGPFAVLRRAKSIKSAGEKERDVLLGDSERLETWAAWLVLAAIVLEAVVWASPLCPFLFKIGNFTADAAVAIGVYGEMRFGHVIGDILKLRLAEATDRAAKLEKEAAELRTFSAYRHIPPDKLQKISASLRVLAPSIILNIEWERSDTEAFWYANEIANAFRFAGVTSIGGVPNSYSGRETFGVWLSTASTIDTNVIWSAFRDEGVSFGTHPWDGLRLMPMHPYPNVFIFVGHKQLPRLPIFAAPS